MNNTVSPFLPIIISMFVSIKTFIIPISSIVQQVGQTISYPTISGQSDGFSRNWAGYAATNGTFTKVTGTWTVPQITGNSPGADATWVGIGGVTTRDLIQAGTQTIIDRTGQVSYEAFYEILPDVSQPMQVNVKAGDSITVSIDQTSQSQWQISLKDNTNGESSQIMQTYNSSLSSAEWIEEAPSSLRRIYPLDNFGTIPFSNGTTVKNGQTVTIAEANAKTITMGAQNQILASVSNLGNDNASFTVTRENSTISQSSEPTTVYQIPLRVYRRHFSGFPHIFRRFTSIVR